jgi:hypothetical protein
MIQSTISFLKRNGFKKMETNSYANDECNVVFEDGKFAVANNEGRAIYSNDNSIFWLIGALSYYHYIPKNYIE